MTDRSRSPISARALYACALFAVLAGIALAPRPARAWGQTAHLVLSRAAVLALPSSLPPFVRTPAAIDEIAALGPELDRSKGAGNPHDADRNPGHYADVDDDGRISGIVALDRLPKTMESYDSALRKGGSDAWRAGYLPYAIADGWEQVRKDFAWWRVDRLGAERASDAHTRAVFERMRALRETLTLRDIGVWGHYVGDASQPLHVSTHYDGWGTGPNPEGFRTVKGAHSHFEDVYARRFATVGGVRAKMSALASSQAPILSRVAAYLEASNAQVIPFYRLERDGAFALGGTPAGTAFLDARLAFGASEMRDLIVEAWRESEDASVGYPETSVRALERRRGALPPSLAVGTE